MAAARQNAAAAFRLGGMQKAARGACGREIFKKYHYVNQFLLKIELARHHKFDRQVTNQEECGIHEN